MTLIIYEIFDPEVPIFFSKCKLNILLYLINKIKIMHLPIFNLCGYIFSKYQ